MYGQKCVRSLNYGSKSKIVALLENLVIKIITKSQDFHME